MSSTCAGEKHLVECRCILSQFRKLPDAPNHKFVVFSVVDESDNVVVKHVQCDNCGIVHRIVGLCRSEIVQGQEALRSVITLDEIKLNLPEKLVAILEGYDLDQATWEQVQFVIENQRWGDHVILKQEVLGDHKQGKYIRLLGNNLFKIEVFDIQLTF